MPLTLYDFHKQTYPLALTALLSQHFGCRAARLSSFLVGKFATLRPHWLAKVRFEEANLAVNFDQTYQAELSVALDQVAFNLLDG